VFESLQLPEEDMENIRTAMLHSLLKLKSCSIEILLAAPLFLPDAEQRLHIAPEGRELWKRGLDAYRSATMWIHWLPMATKTVLLGPECREAMRGESDFFRYIEECLELLKEGKGDTDIMSCTYFAALLKVMYAKFGRRLEWSNDDWKILFDDWKLRKTTNHLDWAATAFELFLLSADKISFDPGEGLRILNEPQACAAPVQEFPQVRGFYDSCIRS
jgi:hypothetical protein